MSEISSSVAASQADSATLAWAVNWPATGVVPQWVASLVERLGRQLSAQVALSPKTALAPEGCHLAPGLPGLVWALDAKLFGDTPELQTVAAAWTRCANTAAPMPLAVLALGSQVDEPLESGVDVAVIFTVAGLPACELLSAVRAAVAQGQGDLLIQAKFLAARHPAPVVWQWRVGVDELSLQRTVRSVLELLGEMILLATQVLKKNLMPQAQCPLPVRPPDAVEGSHAWRATRHALRRALMVDQWGMTVYRQVPSDTWLPCSGGIDLLPPPDRFWADPFLVEDGGTLWVFFEELRFNQQKGYLSCLAIDAQGQVGAPQIVLEENWHLSYPQVFQHDGQWYLLPESSARKNLVLYAAEKLPGPWKPVAELLSNCRVADATVWQERGQWHMLASVGTQQGPINDMLQAYSAPALTGPWVRAADTPVRVDSATARPAGPRFQHAGKWYRPVQDCRQRYGRATHLLAMEGADGLALEERVVATLEPREGSSLQCVHTYCRTENHLAIDWLRWRFKGDNRRIGSAQDIALRFPLAAVEQEAA
jgi:hypothetical protein